MKKTLLIIVAAFMLPLLYCCDDDVTPEQVDPDTENPGQTDPEPEEEEPDGKVTVAEKPVVLWIDSNANFSRLKTKANIINFLELAKEAGFNSLVVDVKGTHGEVMYESEYFPLCTSAGGTTIENRGFDYLGYFIEKAKEMGFHFTASISVMTMGKPSSKSGPAYYDDYWNDKCCVEWLPTGLTDIRDDEDATAAFLNPILPEVKAYIKQIVTEIVTKYDIDGFCLDYCRYLDINSDFSEASKEAFEEYSGLTVENFPEDIYTYASENSDRSDYTPGKYYNEWIEWRSAVIQDCVTYIRETIKSIKPEVDLEYWAASWWPLQGNGQNWASPNINSSYSYWWATEDYYKTGFADRLDIFQLGAYLNKVYPAYDSSSVAYAISWAKKLIGDDCTIYGTVSCASSSFELEDAVHLCLTQTAGCMVFELSHIVNYNRWDEVRAGVDRAWAELGIE